MRTSVLRASLAFAACLTIAGGLAAKSEKSHKITIAGCLHNGGDPNSWTLVNIAGNQPPGRMARTEASSYVLVPEGVDFPKYSGQRVEVTGKLARQGSMTGQTESASEVGKNSTVPAAATLNGTRNESSSISSEYELRVSSIRSVGGGTCP